MTKLIVNAVDSRSTSTEFKDIITANGAKQWLDTYGVIKAFKNTIDEDVTIPANTNCVTAGTCKITASASASGNTVTCRGEWRIV